MTRALSAIPLLLCLALAGCAMDGSPLPADLPDDEAASLATPGDPATAGARQSGERSGSSGTPAGSAGEAAVYPKGGGVTPAAVCGDSICTPGVENCGTCPGDCPCWQQGTICSSGQCVPICGDGICAPSLEDCGLCPVDCPCAPGTVCQNRQCRAPDPCDGDICCRKPWLCEQEP